MKKITQIIVLATAIMFCFSNLSVAQSRPEHELHSMMIYNFLKYIQWPGDQNSGTFVIGVIGSNDVYNTLNQWYGNKTRGNKSFVIKKFTSIDEITDCQLLYVGEAASDKFDQVNAKIQNSSTLTITDKNGLGQKGSCINFRIIDNRLKFELNQASVERSNLKISSQLTAMAILI